MIKISASLLSCRENLESITKEYNNLDIDLIHMDIMDQKFVPFSSFDNDEIEIIANTTNKPLDVHLMVDNLDTVKGNINWDIALQYICILAGIYISNILLSFFQQLISSRLSRETVRKIRNDLIEQLRIVHKLILSHTYDDVKVIKTFDRDTACELGCPSEQYLSSDWESEVKFDDNFDKFLSNCMLDKCQSYKFVICDNGKISIKKNGLGFYTDMDLGIVKCHFEMITGINLL